MKSSLGELARALACELKGDPNRTVEGVAHPRNAGPTHVAALISREGLAARLECAAGALLVEAEVEDARPQLVVENGRAALARLIEHFHPTQRPAAGIHPTAVVDARAEVSPSATIGAFCVVEAGARVEAGACLEAFAYVGPGAVIGDRARIGIRATICQRVEIANDVVIGPGAVIGAEGFGLWKDGPAWRRIKSVGAVVVEERARVGANSCVDAGTLVPTRVGRGAQVDNLVQLGHNAQLGDATVICAQSGVGGSATIGSECELGGQVGVANHVSIGARARIGAKSGVGGDVPPGATYSGYPAVPHRRWLRGVAVLGRLGSAWRKLIAERES